MVARLHKELDLGQILETKTDDGFVRLSIGRKRQARLPVERILYRTGLDAAKFEDLQNMRDTCKSLVPKIDLFQTWDLLVDDRVPSTLLELADLYWGNRNDPHQNIALLLQLEQDPIYFKPDEGLYSPRSRENVQLKLGQRTRAYKNAKDAKELALSLTRGDLPIQPTEYQSSLMRHLHGFVVYGDEYARSELAKDLLRQVNPHEGNQQKLGFNTLVTLGLLGPDEPLELEHDDITIPFPTSVINEAKNITSPIPDLFDELRDLRDMWTVTIDDDNTKDHDDAISVEVLTPTNSTDPAVYHIGIHIADVTPLVIQDSELDAEAKRRTATIYLPEYKIPMIPTGVSEKLGSLKPGHDRCTLSLMAVIDEMGGVLKWELIRSVINSNASVSYLESDTLLENPLSPLSKPLNDLLKIAKALKGKRDLAGAITINRPEMAIRVQDHNQVCVGLLDRESPSRTMVAEMMIFYNSILAKYCQDNNIPAPYRCQEIPDPATVALMPDGPLGWYKFARVLHRAYVSTTPGPHGGLGVGAYVQVTSPLRRYADLILQRQVIGYLTGSDIIYSKEAISSISKQADHRLRELGTIEDSRKRYWFLKYLQQSCEDPQRRDRFHAHVLDSHGGRNALVELSDYPFRLRVRLVGYVEAGELVWLELLGVDLWHRTAQFKHVI